MSSWIRNTVASQIFQLFLLWRNHGYTLRIAKVKALYFPLARLACVARGVYWCVFSLWFLKREIQTRES